MSTGSIRSKLPGGSVVSVNSFSPQLVPGLHHSLALGWILRAERKGLRPARAGADRVRDHFGGGDPLPGQTVVTSNIKESHVFCVADDERAAGFDVLAHQHAEQLVRGRRVV